MFKKGNKSHTEGKTKETYAPLAIVSKKLTGRSISLKTRHKISANKVRGANISKALTGRKLTPEWKKNISLRHHDISGKNNPMFGKHHSEKTKRLLSERKRAYHMRAPNNQIGAKNPMWKGGKSFEPYGVEFNRLLKHQIRSRDNFCCQICGVHQSEIINGSGQHIKLHIHHIDYDKKNNIPENLISLCFKCHEFTHTKRKIWKKYFQTQMTWGELVMLALDEPEFFTEA